MADNYWNVTSEGKTSSELKNCLIKDIQNPSKFTYHIGKKEFSIDFSTGNINFNGEIIKAPKDYDASQAKLYYISTRRNGSLYMIKLGYTVKDIKSYIIFDYLGKLISKVNL